MFLKSSTFRPSLRVSRSGRMANCDQLSNRRRRRPQVDEALDHPVRLRNIQDPITRLFKLQNLPRVRASGCNSLKTEHRDCETEERRMKIPRGKYVAKMLDSHRYEVEHFHKCKTCGGWVDCRDLGSVFDHQGPHSLPSEDRMH